MALHTVRHDSITLHCTTCPVCCVNGDTLCNLSRCALRTVGCGSALHYTMHVTVLHCIKIIIMAVRKVLTLWLKAPNIANITEQTWTLNIANITEQTWTPNIANITEQTWTPNIANITEQTWTPNIANITEQTWTSRSRFILLVTNNACLYLKIKIYNITISSK